ncbi:Ig-like domain-containing protein, partial [Psychromonas aquatilis]
TPDAPLADGTEVSATATDSAGNESGPVTATVDAAINVTIDESSLADTSDNTPILTGTVDTDADSVTVMIGGHSYDATVDTANGSWSVGVTTPLAVDGDYTVTVTATDALGNTDEVTGDLTLDTSAPGAPTVDETNGKGSLTGTAE